MILRADKIAQQLRAPDNPDDPLAIRPQPDLAELDACGSAPVDLRLGCWFQTFRSTECSHLDVYDSPGTAPGEAQLTKQHYVVFGAPFILHPRQFVLAVTLEWIRLPSNLAGYVVGRSSWGRHGLIIATATMNMGHLFCRKGLLWNELRKSPVHSRHNGRTDHSLLFTALGIALDPLAWRAACHGCFHPPTR